MKLEGKKFQILVWGLCLVLAVGLFYMVNTDTKLKAERNLQLQQQVQQPEKDYGKITEQQTEIYENLYSDLSIPEIIFWGDNLMTGVNGDSLTTSIKNTFDKNLLKNLTNTFHTVLEDGEHVAPTVSLVNMGVINEDIRHILVRAGVNTLYLRENLDLSSSKQPVPVFFTDDQDSDGDTKDTELLFADQYSDLFGDVTISGIHGSLEKTDEWIDSTHPRYAFIREEEGDSQWVEAGTQVELETASKYVGDIPIFYFENISDQDVDDFVPELKKLVKRYTNYNFDKNEQNVIDSEQEPLLDLTNSLPFVIICKANDGSNLDIAMESEFGDHYIRTDSYSSEMYENSFWSLSQNIYKSLDNQGCFSDIKAQIRTAIEEVNDL